MATPLDDVRIARGMQAQLASRRMHLARGEKPLGWKVGLGSAASMQRLAITAPLIGFLTDRALVASGATVSLAAWSKPVVEPEIAVYMAHDLHAGVDREATRAAIAAIGPAIELADLDCPPDDVEQILCGNIYQRGVILGSRDTRRAGCVLDGLSARVIRNGAAFAQTTDPQAITGDYVDIVRHVANTLAASGERLRKGEVIITGSIVPPLLVAPGEDIVFALDPIGAVTVTFAPAGAA